MNNPDTFIISHSQWLRVYRTDNSLPISIRLELKDFVPMGVKHG